MHDEQIEQIKNRSDAMGKAFDDFLKFLSETADANGQAFDISQVIPGTNISISDLRARHALVSGLIQKFDNKGGSLVPLADLTAMIRGGRAVINSITQATDTIRTHSVNSGGINRIDYENFTLVGNNGSINELQGYFKGLFDNYESYLKSFQDVFQATNPSRAAFNFSSAADALSKIIAQANNERIELHKDLKLATEKLQNISNKENEISSITQDSSIKQSAINEIAARSTEAIAQISARIDEANSLAANVQELKHRVESYEIEFRSFQDAIDRRNAVFEEGSTSLSDLINKFREQEKTFENLIEKSNQMLSASTVSGLAAEFGTIKNDLSNDLKDSIRAFKWSIGFLTISAIPLLALVFSPFFAMLFPDNDAMLKVISGLSGNQSSWHYLGQVVARFIILLPAIWYVTFCTSRYNSIFKLKEHYSFKYSMAVSVEGFKKQAPNYQDLIAALVFEQLAFNPADKLGKKHDVNEYPPHPIAKLLLGILRKNTE